MKFSIIVPVRNEEKYIEKCLMSLILQNYPKNEYEIIVIDAMSTDGTRKLLDKFRTNYSELVKVFDNPLFKQVIGRNIGIKNSAGIYIVMFSGHAYAHSDYLKNLERIFLKEGDNVAVVGANIIIPKDENYFAHVIGKVQSTHLGGGGTGFIESKSDSISSSPGFPAYKKKILNKIGFLDEKLETGEDTDLNWRIKVNGFKLMVSYNAIVYYYRNHNTPFRLFNRLYNYGVGRGHLTKKHPSSFNYLTIFPILLSLLIMTLPFWYFLSTTLFNIFITLLIIYAISITVSSFLLCYRTNSIKFIIALPVYFLIHFSFGIGFLHGLIK